MKLSHLITLLVISISCYAQDWQLIAEDKVGNTIEVDCNSINRKQELVYVWIKKTYNDHESKKKYHNECLELLHNEKYATTGIPVKVLLEWASFEYSLTYEVYDCSTQKNKTLSIIDYTEKGEVLSSYDFDEVTYYKRIIPGSIGDIIMKSVCEKNIYEANGKKYAIPIEKQELFIKKHPKAKLIETK